VPGKYNAIACKAVDVRRFDLSLTVEADISPAEVIGHDKYYIRFVAAVLCHGRCAWSEESKNDEYE
jgi:hypothetical protein